MTIKVTERHAREVLKVVDAGLCSGVGTPEPGKMCVEAAACYALGLPHGDNPICVSPVLRALKITLNDLDWSSDQARASGLRKLAVLQLGTDHDFDEKLFLKKLVDVTICKVVPRALRATGIPSLEASAVLCETEGTKSAESAAWSAAWSARSAAWSAGSARSAAWSAGRSAGSAAESAARSAAWSAGGAARSAGSAAYDAELVFFADRVADILISMEVPAVKWLDLL